MSYTFKHSQSKALRRSFLPHPSSKSQRFQAVLNFNYIQPYFDSFNLVLALSHVWLSGTPWIVAHQASLSMEFSRQEYWSG